MKARDSFFYSLQKHLMYQQQHGLFKEIKRDKKRREAERQREREREIGRGGERAKQIVRDDLV